MSAYFPNENWFKYPEGDEILRYNKDSEEGANITVECPLNGMVNAHIKGGSIIGYQNINRSSPPVTTEELRTNYSMNLMVAPNNISKGLGSIYYDNPNSLNPFNSTSRYQIINLEYSEGILTLKCQNVGFVYKAEDMNFRSMRVLGADLGEDTFGCLKLINGTGVTLDRVLHSDPLYTDLLMKDGDHTINLCLIHTISFDTCH